MGNASDIDIKAALKALYLRIRAGILGFPCLFRRKNLESKPLDFKNILFIRVDRIGDMVLSTPAFAAIKARWPRSRLTVLASSANAGVLKNNPHVDEVIIYSPDITPSERKEILKGIRDRAFDLALDPYDDCELRTAWLAWQSKADISIGYRFAGRESFFNGPVLAPRPGRHFVDSALELLAQIGCPPVNRQPIIYLDEMEEIEAEKWLKSEGLGAKPILAIHPGGYYETQRWPREHFASLVRLICERGDMDIIAFGAPDEKVFLNHIAAETSGFPHIFAERNIRMFLAILSRCQVLVCNNSGPLHCATALGIPTISFMGPTDKDRWHPLGEGHIVLRRDDLPCIGCGLGHCRIKTHDCMKSIYPTAVLAKTDHFIDTSAK